MPYKNPEDSKKYYQAHKAEIAAKQKEYNAQWRRDNPEKMNAFAKKWRARNPEHMRALYRNNSRREREKQIAQYPQPEDGCCELCGRYIGSEKLQWDHCHRFGHYRAWLCKKCNWGLGHFLDDPELLKKAATYITHHRPHTTLPATVIFT